MSRRSERRASAFLLYQRDLLGQEFAQLYGAYERDNGEPVTAFTRGQAEGAWERRDELDAVIDGAAEGWTAERMAVLERNVLRLAVWELQRKEVPAAVAIDEAVGLAKRYASPEAAVLVNGILGRIARSEGWDDERRRTGGDAGRGRAAAPDARGRRPRRRASHRGPGARHPAGAGRSGRDRAAGRAARPPGAGSLIEEYLRELSVSDLPGLDEAARYSLLAGGKRVRPRLCLATARSAGADPARALPAAAAVEMVHAFSLVHDDLPALDDDDERRGQPSSHVRYGEAVAVLVGDALLSGAYRLIAERLDAPAEVRLGVIEELTRGVAGMIDGQYLDVTPSARPARTS